MTAITRLAKIPSAAVKSKTVSVLVPFTGLLTNLHALSPSNLSSLVNRITPITIFGGYMFSIFAPNCSSSSLPMI